MSDLLCLIPARGGSKGVLRKNLRLVRGQTLIQHAVNACKPWGRTVVSTDDPDIAAVARMCGAEVWDRPPDLASDQASIDDLVLWTRRHDWQADLLVFQPTCPQAARHLPGFLDDVRRSDQGTVMGWSDRHILWLNRDTPLTSRRQRQDNPGVLREVGVRFYPKGVCDAAECWDAGEPILDVDTPEDLAAVRRQRKRILFRFACDRRVGSGHVRRCVQIADELQHHHVMLAPKPGADLGLAGSLTAGHQMVTDGYPADLIVNDTLDTSEEEMFDLRFRAPVVALEDSGPGAAHASLLINELYSGGLSGPDWAVLRPVFTAVPWPHRFDHDGPPRLLVTFGGTDPSDLTGKLGRLVGRQVWDSVVVPPPGKGGDADLASLLVWADLVVCSGGRTVWEAMACGTPALVLCQNPRELSHTHLSPQYGVLSLGLGLLVDDGDLLRHLTVLLGDRLLLADMSDRQTGIVDGRGVQRIAHRIEGLLEGL